MMLFLDPNQYPLRDLKSEKEIQCNLQESISRAQSRPLFQDVTVYATPSVVPPISDLTKIVTTAGGTVVKRQPSMALLQEKDEQVIIPQEAFVVYGIMSLSVCQSLFLCNFYV